jgi:hypothetical protein
VEEESARSKCLEEGRKAWKAIEGGRMSLNGISSGANRRVALMLAAALTVALAISLGSVGDSFAGGSHAVAAKKCKKGKKSAVAAKKCKKATPGDPPPLPDFCGVDGNPCEYGPAHSPGMTTAERRSSR